MADTTVVSTCPGQERTLDLVGLCLIKYKVDLLVQICRTNGVPSNVYLMTRLEKTIFETSYKGIFTVVSELLGNLPI